MFTGIVQAVGTVRAVEEREGGRGLRVEAPAALVADLPVGGSVAVDGACLTAVSVRPDGFDVDVIGTTLSRTVAGGYQPGTEVNLERAVRVGDRLDGHLVQGHVDGLGVVRRISRRGTHWLLDLELPEEVDRVTILHGSITVQGVSLTVNALPSPGTCQVALVPHTWERTTLSSLGPGDRVNLEGDLIGKYVGRMLAPHLTESGRNRT